MHSNHPHLSVGSPDGCGSRSGLVIARSQAFASARAVLDRARARRDSMPVREAARVAAVGSDKSADEIEFTLRRLRKQARAAPVSASRAA